MVIAIQILLIIHVLAAMLWLGGSTFLPRRLRRALDSERVHARSELSEVVRMGTVMGIGASLTVVTGLVMILMTPGGFASLGPRYHVALSLGILWLGLGFFSSRTSVKKIKVLVVS